MIVVHALGAAEIEVGDLRIKPTSTKKFAFLLYLAAERGRRVPRSALRDLLFPELSETNAGHALRELIYQLRQLGALIQTDKDGVWLPAEAVRSDFSEVIAADTLTDEQVRAVEGGFLPGFAPSLSESYREWYEQFREASCLRLVRQLVTLIDASKARGNWGRCEIIARACLALDRYNENASIAIAESMAHSGQTKSAVDLLDRFREETGLARELLVPILRARQRISEFKGANYGLGLGRFVGRASELAALTATLARGKAGSPQVTCLAGAPGIGKSRLATELSAIAHFQGWSVVRAGLQPGDTERPLSAFSDLAQMLFDQPGALGCTPDSLAWIRRLLQREAGAEPLNAQEVIAARVSRAVKDLVDAISAESPLLVIVDDVQWIDAASVRLMRALTQPGEPRPLFILLTARTDECLRELALENPAFTLVAIGPLDRNDCVALIESRQSLALDAELQEWMIDIAQGNPLFVDQLVRHVMETGQRFVIPNRLVELIDERLRRLSAHARQALGAIVRLGKRASIDRLIHVLELPTWLSTSATHELESAGLIRLADSIEPSHWLIAESEHRLATPISAQIVHSRIASKLAKEAETDSDPSLLWDLSQHLIAAGSRTQASEVTVCCAEHALSIGRPRYCAELLIRASTLVVGPRQIDLLEKAARTAAASLEADLVIEACDRLRSLTPLPSDLEIERVWATAGFETNVAALLPFLQEVFSSHSRPMPERARAAFAFLVACDHDLVAAPAIEAYDSLRQLWSSPDIDHAQGLKLRMIFESGFGDLDCLAGISAELLNGLAAQKPEVAADVARTAYIGYWRAGLAEKAIETIGLAYAKASEVGLTRLQNHLALMTASNLLDLSRDHESDWWFERARTHEWGMGVEYPKFMTHSLESERALAREDWVDLRRLATTGAFGVSSANTGRVCNWAEAIGWIHSHLNGDQVNPEELVSRVFAPLSPGFAPGDSSDFRIAAALTVLEREGHDQTARALSSQYLGRYRRPRSKYSRALDIQLAKLE